MVKGDGRMVQILCEGKKLVIAFFGANKKQTYSKVHKLFYTRRVNKVFVKIMPKLRVESFYIKAVA